MGSQQCSICRGEGFNPFGASQLPKLALTPNDLVKISQKYIADAPLLFYHKSTTDGEWGPWGMFDEKGWAACERSRCTNTTNVELQCFFIGGGGA